MFRDTEQKCITITIDFTNRKFTLYKGCYPNNQIDSNKAYGHDMIRVRTLKLCGDPICKPLELIFKACLRNGRFLLESKKVYAVSIHKKGDKQIIKNYRPVSLLPICGKIFERLLYDTTFDFFSKNNLFSPNRSGFRPGDSCISHFFQLIMKS